MRISGTGAGQCAGAEARWSCLAPERFIAGRSRHWLRAAIVAACVLSAPPASHAQQRETLTADFTFYGDNTEFANPFREGETLLGVFGRIVLDVAINARVSLQGGVFGNERFGSARAFEQVRPVLSLIVHNPRQRFVFGAFPPVSALPVGSDRQTPHGLLPPLQAETLMLTRPWEAGLQWRTTTGRLAQGAWINWQALNTERQRERFDAGVSGTGALGRILSLGYQWHIVHLGGQQFAVGPVSDSQAVAIGPRLAWRPGELDELSIELWGLASRHVPDREATASRRTGKAVLVRASGVGKGWRGHVLAFRGDDFVKVEGDPNYQSVRRDGRPFRAVRDYAEAGLSRRFEPAPGVAVEASLRLHRVESHYEYSYRIIGRTSLAWKIR